MSPIARENEKDGDEDRAPGLHAEERARSAGCAGREAGEKVGAAPGNCRGDAQQNAAGHLLCLSLFDFEAELGHDFLQIFPDVGFRGRIAQ
jgi:hypothetical protein